MSDCKYGDPACPCQDGDTCHYEGENPMTPPYTLTPNSGGWNCTSADGKICVYGRTEEEAKMRCKLAQLVQLPPYDVTAEEQASADYVMLTDMEKLLAARLVCRERQLLEAIGQLAAEKLRADAFRHALKQCADLDENDPEADPCDCIICREGRELLARTPEEWAALALSGKEQSNG